MDKFIECANALLVARPDTTRVSTRLTHKNVSKSGDRVSASAKPAVAIIKVYDPVSGAMYKYRLEKQNELSRILSSLGPQNIELTHLGSTPLKKRGLASIMSDVEPVEPPQSAEPVAPEAPPNTATSGGKRKKSKK